MNQLGFGGYRTEDGTAVAGQGPTTTGRMVANPHSDDPSRWVEDSRTEGAAVENYRAEKKLSDDLAAEHAARYDLTKEQENSKAEYLAALDKVQSDAKMLMMLAALSGNPQYMQMAQAMGTMGIDRLNAEYGTAADERTSTITKMLMTNSLSLIHI